MFKHIEHIEDIRPFVMDKKEIQFHRQENGIIVGCYNISGNNTFDNIESIECRGISFNENGEIVSRPLHKFFNLGEKEGLDKKSLEKRKLLHVYDKMDGSMINTAYDKDKGLMFKSKRSFDSDVVKLTNKMLLNDKFHNIMQFSKEVAQRGYTATFELIHPQNRIVVSYPNEELRLLHIRHNVTGEYVLLDKNHEIHNFVDDYNIKTVEKLDMSLGDVLDGLENKKDMEGYVLHFDNGDMVKIKCPWYLRLHKTVTFLRERDIARSVLNGEIDDIKGALREINMDMQKVLEIEKRVIDRINNSMERVKETVENDKDISDKDFVEKHGKDELIAFMMMERKGRDWGESFISWYERRKLKNEYSLDAITGALFDDKKP